jgi:hypothetical protein
MATSNDEFDPPDWLRSAAIAQIVGPQLAELSECIGTPYVADVYVYVRDECRLRIRIRQCAADDRSDDENVQVRLRFRKTYRDDRLLFSMDTQHADIWRSSGFSGVWIKGDLVMDGDSAKCTIRGKTICYNQGWHRW